MRRVCHLGIFAFLASGCFQPEPVATSALPWTIGDYWTGLLQDVGNPGKILLQNATLTAIDPWFSDFQQEMAYRIRVASYYREGLEIDFMFLRIPDLYALGTKNLRDVDVEYLLPCPVVHWPLKVGRQAIYQCFTKGTVDGIHSSFYQNETIEVEAYEEVHVPAGNFSAFRVHVTGDAGGLKIDHLYWYAPSACNVVRREIRGENNNQWWQVPGTYELKSFHCASALRRIS